MIGRMAAQFRRGISLTFILIAAHDAPTPEGHVVWSISPCRKGGLDTVKAKKDRSGEAKGGAGAPTEKLKGKDYDKAFAKLHVELVKLQEWVKYKGSRSASSSRDAMARARAGRSRRSPSG
jgi:hypothetical protein